MLPGTALERLQAACDLKVWREDEPPSRGRLMEELASTEGLLCLLTDNIDAGVLEAAPRLRAISTMAVGYDHIDVDAATARRIPVTNTPGVLTETTADFAFALLLAAARRLPEAERAVRDGRWPAWSPTFLAGVDIAGATLGIVGFGAIGQAVARRARGFGMRALCCSRTPRPEAAAVLGVEETSFDQLLGQSDFVSVHVPLTRETRHLFNHDAFARMKPGAIFVNTARGAVVDESALHHALETHHLAAAALDVAETEPVSPHDPLLRLPNLLITPHIASASMATRAKMADMAADNLLDALAGRPPPQCVNPEALGSKHES
jgi:glyoxylate reductase